MQILNISSVETSGDYIHAILNIYIEGLRYREVYCKHNLSTGRSKCFLVLHGNISQTAQLTTSECNQINEFILSELLQTA
jgi:hypothetical protein